MPKLIVNDKEIEVENGLTVLQACEQAGYEIPYFCYHPRLSIAGNCRMCLVEIEKSPKPVASCAMPVAEGMVIRTNTPLVEKARKGVLELLLFNHPLDCPICDQGGECDLQDLTMGYGPSSSRFDLNKRAVTNKYMGPLVKTIMTRCIHCTRCVRFANEIAGTPEIGGIHRGEHTEITSYLEGALTSELSGNLIDICPVGALTNKPYTFHGRPWELTKTNSIDVMDAVGSNIRIDTRGQEVMRVLPRLNEDINEEWISDKTRFSYDGLSRQRLDKAYVRKDGKLTPVSLEEAFETVAHILTTTPAKEIAALSGDLADCESVTVLKELMQKVGSVNMDCRIDGAVHDSTNRSSYIFNSTIAGIEESDFILIVASDVRHEAPLVNARIRKRYLQGGVQIAVVGTTYDLTYPYTHAGEQAPTIKEIFDGSHSICAHLKAAQRPMIIIGQGALNRRDSREILRLCQEIAEKHNMIQDGWNGFNVLHTAAGRVGALDLGFTPKSNGLATSDILTGCQRGQIKTVFLNNVDNIPGGSFGEACVIYLGHHGDEGAHRADIILPGLAYTEKFATYVNTEGRPQQTEKAVANPGDAQEDWGIINQIATKAGFNLGFESRQDVLRRMIEINPIFAEMNCITPATWQKITSKYPESMSHISFKSPIDNFYMTDPISRHSSIMAACVTEIAGSGCSKKCA
ncbi:NADH-quinone oxidoreductase subunit NuoG [Candidatus Odyssella acanthamoebae]|uniref:NADH-quinone oxidoreductase subunit NuoG n=1 Tax=Candidatus Odyssella acanthamoebae TaxID=91604 RepID=UPI000571B3F3|nr:NADH-quinone oxidoreductase subunit NuoG [Candidatus Paracaedibacter acanthamoebae]